MTGGRQLIDKSYVDKEIDGLVVLSALKEKNVERERLEVAVFYMKWSQLAFL